MIHEAAQWLTRLFEGAGMTVIAVAALVATARFLRQGLGERAWTGAYEAYRANLGRGILLGLELLVAADIIETVMAPLDLRSVAILGLIVLIRTFLSFSLEIEIKGHLPWRQAGAEEEAKG